MSALNANKVYLVRGSTLDRIEKRARDLWNGKNVQRGPGIRIRTAGTGGYVVSAAANDGPALPSSGSGAVSAWPWKVYNSSGGGYGRVRVNGGDGFVPTLNGTVGQIGGQNCDTETGGFYPQLAITGNGVVYGYATLSGSGGVTSLAIYYGGTVPSPDTANPPTYAAQLLATITGFTSGTTPAFAVNNATNYGFTSLAICGAYATWI